MNLPMLRILMIVFIFFLLSQLFLDFYFSVFFVTFSDGLKLELAYTIANVISMVAQMLIFCILSPLAKPDDDPLDGDSVSTDQEAR